MDTTLSAVSANTRAAFVRAAGQLCFVGALIGAMGGLVTGFIPAAVESDQFSYPYGPTGFLIAQIVFVLNHILVLVGMFGLARIGAEAHLGLRRTGVWIAVVGWALLTLCEVVAMTFANSAYPTPRTDTLDTGYGVATILIGIGLVLAGIAVARGRGWTGWARWVTLACGIAVFVMVIPGVFGPFLAGRLVLAAWMLMLAGLGVALMRTAPRSDAHG